MTTQTTGAAELPEALRLADLLLALQTHLGPRRDEKDPDEQAAWDGYTDAAAALCRLHAENEALRAQQDDAYDHGPQAETVEEAARDVGKWLNERPNRPLDLRHVAMLTHHAKRTAHVQNPAEIEHVAGDVSKNGAELNTSTQQPAPAGAMVDEWFLRSVIMLCNNQGASPESIENFDSGDKWIADLWRQAERALPTAPQSSPAAQAASSAVLKAIREANMQLVRTGDNAFMLVPYKVATAQAAGSVPAPVLDSLALMKVVMQADEALSGRCTRGTTNWAAAIGKAVQDAVLAARARLQETAQ